MSYFVLGLRVLLLVMGWILVVFFLWRRFRLDIEEKQILSFGLWTAIFAVGTGFYLRIWIGLIGIILILWIYANKYKWDGFEIVDFILPLVALFIGLAAGEWLVATFCIVGWLVSARFRTFSWYKSGKPGLGGLVIVAVIGLYLVIHGFKTNFVDQVAGIWLLTASMVSIYLRSRLKLLK